MQHDGKKKKKNCTQTRSMENFSGVKRIENLWATYCDLSTCTRLQCIYAIDLRVIAVLPF